MDLSITVHELSQKLQNKNLLIIDGRPFSSYTKSHIPGAVNVDLMQFHWLDTSKKGIAEFNRQTKILLSNIGVSKNKDVVFYDDVSGMSAARGVWLLLYFSHSKVAMLDGGLKRWEAEGFKTERTTRSFIHSTFTGKPNVQFLADFARIRSRIKRRKAIIIDARSKEEYEGSISRAARKGHIPTAINIEWEHNLEREAFKSIVQLEQMYKFSKDEEVITYCQGGYRAANSFVVLKALGFRKVRMYLGSWGEWGNMPDLPVETASHK